MTTQRPQIDPNEIGLKSINFPYLTKNQNLFLQRYLTNDCDAAAAFRAVFPSQADTSVIRRKANSLLNLGPVRMALAEIEKAAVAVGSLTLADHLVELAKLRDAARDDLQFGPAIQAEIARGKAAGLYVQRVEVDAKVTQMPTPDMPPEEATSQYLEFINATRH